MIKFKIYGVFFALIYSFFFYTTLHKDDYFPREETAARSQIRALGRRSEDKILPHLKISYIPQANISNNYSPPGSEGFRFNIPDSPSKTWFFLDTKRTFLLKTLATERNRMLRN